MMVWESAPGQVLLHDRALGRWTSFRNPLEVVEAYRCQEILSCLRHVESVVRDQGCYAAGFLSYEAGPAFDPAIHAHPPDAFPLLWFGLYAQAELLSLAAAPRGGGSGYTLGAWTPGVDAGTYRRGIARIREHIARGDTYQVNYTLRLRASFSGSALGFFLDTAARQEEGYFAFLDLGRFAVCSFSPELFFTLEGREVVSRPMKGTIRRGAEAQEDREYAETLLSSEKDRAENVMIVDMVRNDLGRIAVPGSVEVPALFKIEPYRDVWQMTSTVRAQTNASWVDLLRALFPPASVTGAPKYNTTRIITEMEDAPRHVYTGAIGTLAPDRRSLFSVAIRTALVDRGSGSAEYGAGGGIVWDSTAEGEEREWRAKAEVVTNTRAPRVDGRHAGRSLPAG